VAFLFSNVANVRQMTTSLSKTSRNMFSRWSALAQWTRKK